MSIFRIQKDKSNPYVMINRECLKDKRLSAKAKGILAYLLSLPDNWRLYETELTRHFTDGRDSIRSGIKELIRAGYISRGNRRRDDQGRLKEYEYSVYETPQIQLLDSCVGFSNVGQPNTINNNCSESKPAPKKRHKTEWEVWDEYDHINEMEFNRLRAIELEYQAQGSRS